MSTPELNAIKKLTQAVNRLADEFAKSRPTSKPVVFEQHYTQPPVPTVLKPPAEPKAFEDFPLQGLKLPVFLMPERGQTFDIDNLPANGIARIGDKGIDLHVGAEYYTDIVRQIVAEGEPFAITMGVNHRKPLVDTPSGMTHKELDDQIEKLHGPGASAALDAAIADGSIFGGNSGEDENA